MKFIIALLVLTLAAPLPTGATSAGSEMQVPFEEEFDDPFEEVGGSVEVTDPLEPLNRVSFWVNDKIYRYVLSPLCETVSTTVRDTLCAGLSTLLAPMQTAYGGIEFRFRDAGSEFGRFSLLALLHFLDSPFRDGSEERPDLERGLARSGVGPGPYLVLPLLGPSNVRDGAGKVASFYLDSPATLFSPENPLHAENSSLGKAMEDYRSISRVALDPYLSIRDIFSQQQEKENRSHLFAMRSFGDGHRLSSLRFPGEPD